MPPTFFGLPIYEAAQRLAADFGIDTDRPPTKEILEKRRQQTESQQLMENERLCFAVLSDYARVMRDWKVRYAPQSPDEPVHARFMEACHKLDETEYYLDILCEVILTNVPRWSVICLQMVGWTSSRKKSMGGMQREQEVCRA